MRSLKLQTVWKLREKNLKQKKNKKETVKITPTDLDLQSLIKKKNNLPAIEPAFSSSGKLNRHLIFRTNSYFSTFVTIIFAPIQGVRATQDRGLQSKW